MTRREYRKFVSEYRNEIARYTWITPPSAITRHPNRKPCRWRWLMLRKVTR